MTHAELPTTFQALRAIREGETFRTELQTLPTGELPGGDTLVELGGREVGDTDHMVTETLIRGMYEYWRSVMET